MTSDYQYDDLNRLTALYQFTDADGDRRYDAGETLLASFVYTLDDMGNRTAASEVVDGLTYAYTWTYDGLNRLVQEQLDAGDNALDYTAVYTYDLASNRLTLSKDAGSNGTVDETTTYTYDANDRLLTEVKDVAGTTTGDTNTVYAYGLNNAATQQTGQVVRTGTTSGGGVLKSQTRLSYDVSGRLAQVETDADGDNTYETTTLYAYDDRGLRVSETTPGSGGVTTTYLFDVQNPTGYAQVLEEYVNNVLQRSYTLGLDVLAQTRHDAAARDFLLYDGHGNPRALLTAALAFTQKFAYDAYGVMLPSAQLASAATALTRLLYSGEWTRRDGTQYLRARDYNPATGRFTSLDSYRGNISDPQSLHKYLYANGNPVNRIDPSGMFSIAELGTVNGIQNIVVTVTRAYSTISRLYNYGKRIIQIIDYAKMVIRVARALHQPTPTDAAIALASELRNQFGLDKVNSITQGFQAAFSQIGPNWEKIAKRISERSFDIAEEVAAAIALRLPKYVEAEREGNLQLILFLATGPSQRVSDTIITITDRFAIGVSPGGGRLFGFGARTSRNRNSGYDQWFRVDYWDFRPGQNPLIVHYHVLGDKESHPNSDRIIWQP